MGLDSLAANSSVSNDAVGDCQNIKAVALNNTTINRVNGGCELTIFRIIYFLRR
jgi:hypothetical protein